MWVFLGQSGERCFMVVYRSFLVFFEVVVFFYCLWVCYKKKSVCKLLKYMNNLIKIIKVIVCEKSSKVKYYRVVMWEDENC